MDFPALTSPAPADALQQRKIARKRLAITAARLEIAATTWGSPSCIIFQPPTSCRSGTATAMRQSTRTTIVAPAGAREGCNNRHQPCPQQSPGLGLRAAPRLDNRRLKTVARQLEKILRGGHLVLFNSSEDEDWFCSSAFGLAGALLTVIIFNMTRHIMFRHFYIMFCHFLKNLPSTGHLIATSVC